MAHSNKTIFKVLVTFPKLLEEVINRHNDENGTDFKIIEVVEDEVAWCTIQATNFEESDIFYIGGKMVNLIYRKKEKGEISW